MLKRFAVRRCSTPLIVHGLAMIVLCGCSGSSFKTHAVQGRVELTDGEAEALVGSIVEFMQDADPLVRASGKIMPGGTFTMETLHQGEVISGVPEGSYKARIILSDDDDTGAAKKGGQPVHKRFLDFKTSGLSCTVPSDSVTLKVSRS